MQIPKAGHIVLAIPDLQAPFEHVDALPFVKAVRSAYKPTTIVCLGDEADKHALSEYGNDPDGMTAGLELHNCVEHLRPWYKAFPSVAVCISNHTERIFRKAYKCGIPKGYLKSYREFLEAPDDWHWRDQWEYDGVIYEHGHSFGGGNGRTAGFQLPLHNGKSTVFGHFHSSAGIQYLANESERLWWGFNAGCLIDKKQYAFRYGSKTKAKPVLGCAIIDHGIPFFIPMICNKYERWIGEL